MNSAKCLILFTLILQFNAHSKRPKNLSSLPFSQKIKVRISNGERLVFSSAKNLSEKDKPMQEFKFNAAGLHPKPCWFSLLKIGRYEHYKEYIEYIKSSEYNESTKRIRLFLSADFMPIDLTMDFKIDRINKVGIYNFTFDQGFLKGLVGEIHVNNFGKQCLYYIETNWVGPYTGFAPIILETVSQTLAQIAIDKMYRLTLTLN